MKIKCPNCGYEGKGEKKHRGSWLIALILLLFYIIPGAIYIIWMYSEMKVNCPRCKFNYVIRE
jgi:DNA-directed RNA polymerase subunit RPC12/RpoP